MKRKVADLPSQFLTDLKTSGLTYEEMMESYGVTRWGARKIGMHDDVDEEEAGNHEKIFALNRDQHSLGALKVPVQEEEVNHETETRSTEQAKQTFTNKANTYLKELEKQVKNTETPETSYEEPDYLLQFFNVAEVTFTCSSDLFIQCTIYFMCLTGVNIFSFHQVSSEKQYDFFNDFIRFHHLEEIPFKSIVCSFCCRS